MKNSKQDRIDKKLANLGLSSVGVDLDGDIAIISGDYTVTTKTHDLLNFLETFHGDEQAFWAEIQDFEPGYND